VSDDEREALAEQANERAYADGMDDARKELAAEIDLLLDVNEALKQKIEGLEAEVDSLYAQLKAKENE
jgi:hypothetical protein